MESNQELTMSMFANRADYETAVAELQNIKKVVLDIKSNPELILSLNEGDQVSVDGIVLDVICLPYKQWIYFRTTYSRPDEYSKRCEDDEFSGEYMDYIKHLREKQEGRVYGKACLTREEFKSLIESGNYYIG